VYPKPTQIVFCQCSDIKQAPLIVGKKLVDVYGIFATTGRKVTFEVLREWGIASSGIA
jgi:hypothetical protein